ncbi:jerky protein homolog isoform X3 [Leucoraja erinacea]|uniref:jerky protein homolog isoform X3 n=1 Tax=Leucoraja erinaceus TaxID=7782 RepID=UPI002454529E|nr:jerky protein homolog isoform X3 [Leucoraja erinacea]
MVPRRWKVLPGSEAQPPPSRQVKPEEGLEIKVKEEVQVFQIKVEEEEEEAQEIVVKVEVDEAQAQAAEIEVQVEDEEEQEIEFSVPPSSHFLAMATSCRMPDVLVFDSDIAHRWDVFRHDFDHYVAIAHPAATPEVKASLLLNLAGPDALAQSDFFVYAAGESARDPNLRKNDKRGERGQASTHQDSLPKHPYSTRHYNNRRPVRTVKMSERAADSPMDNREKQKRKHLALSIAQKIELLQKLDRGESVRRLTKDYGVGISTIYDLKKQKLKLLKFYSDSDDQKLKKNMKTLHRAKNEDLDRVLMQWIRQRRGERMPLTGLMVMKQARKYHEELNIGGKCEYSEGWLQKFKKRHGIKYLKICGVKASAAYDAAERYIGEFAKMVSDEKLSPEQIYNADETALYWRYVPRKTLTTADERALSGFKDAKDRVTVLGCVNAASTHMLKLAVLGKSQRPRCFKGVTNLPVHYYANKNAWVTREMFTNWFNNHFVPAARAHCRKAGLVENCKIVLLLDNCSAHPPAEVLVKNNVFGIYLPPNATTLIQPCDQGILHSMKTMYKDFFLNCMLAAVNRGVDIEDFLKEFTLKDAIYALVNAWKDVTKSTLKNAWHELWPTTMFDENELADEDFEGFRVTDEKKIISNLIAYAKSVAAENVNTLESADIEEVLNVDNDAPVVHSLSDGEIAEMVLDNNKHEDSTGSDEDDDIVDTGEKMPIDDMVKLCDQLIGGMEQHTFISAHEIMAVYSIKERLLRQKPPLMRQMTLEEFFKPENDGHHGNDVKHSDDGRHNNVDDIDVSPGSSK